CGDFGARAWLPARGGWGDGHVSAHGARGIDRGVQTPVSATDMTLGPLMIDIEGTSLTPEDRELLAHPLVGAVILFTRNFASIDQLVELVAAIRAARTPP